MFEKDMHIVVDTSNQLNGGKFCRSLWSFSRSRNSFPL